MMLTRQRGSAEATGTGVGIPTVLFIVFLVLKLTGLIDWSWWWVTAPLWIPLALGLAVVAVFVGVTAFRR